MNKNKKSSQYYGVTVRIGRRPECYINMNGKKEYLGSNADLEVLARIYDDAVRQFGLNKKLNFPDYPENNIPNTKLIQLSKGMFATVDEADYEWLNKFEWYAKQDNSDGPCYAERTLIINGKKCHERMHILIMGGKREGYEIDHISTIGTENFRLNLRFVTSSQNNMNLNKRKNCTSKYKGVHWDKSRGKWLAQIKIDGIYFYLGRFNTEKEAAEKYNIKAQELFGDFARLNVID